MNIFGPGDEKIETLDAWAALYASPRSSHQWKEHRSAYSVAEFILNRNGAAALENRVSESIGESACLERAIPEMEVRFDQFGRGRMHDLGIFGTTKSGKSIFVGVEAKVDEPFGAPVRDAYLAAKARQIAGESTNAPARIEQLLKLHFRSPDPSMFDVRYQLLYGTPGRWRPRPTSPCFMSSYSRRRCTANPLRLRTTGTMCTSWRRQVPIL